jgi:CubicO group peptidase (beta-lactamase class C family)
VLSQLLGCTGDPAAPELGLPSTPSFAVTLSSYFPPSEANGGWRKTTDENQIANLGMRAARISELGSYAMSLPYEGYATGVVGFHPSYKAAVVIKGGWIVGEYYNKSAARTGLYYLASNGKSFAMMLMGRLQLEYPELGISLGSRLYDRRWLPEGFPLTDTRKSGITLDHVFRHRSGILPEAQAAIGSGAVASGPGWNFAPFTIGKDSDYPVSAPLYYAPGNPSNYARNPYSSASFNHLSLIFRNVTKLEPSVYLRRAMLNRIGVGRMEYKLPSGMGSFVWATGGNGLASARDYARIAYLLLHEGNWAGRRIFTASWIRQFTTAAGYHNINSNVDCSWGEQYPRDLYRIIGSGVNLAFVIPSLDLVATLNGRTPNSLRDEVSRTYLEKLFAAVTQEYVTCDGRVINGSPAESRAVSALRLINADTDMPMATMTDGMTITLSDLPTRNLNVQATTSPATVGSVRFVLDGQNFRTETSQPYSLAGDDAGDYRPWTPSPGSHTLKATPYSGASATGTAGVSLTVSFTVR